MRHKLSKNQKVKKNDNWLRRKLSKIMNKLKVFLVCLLLLVLLMLNDSFIVKPHPWIGFIEETLYFTVMIVILTVLLFFCIKLVIQDKDIQLYIAYGLLILFLVTLDITGFMALKENLPDIPILMSSNYATITGYPINVQIPSGRGHNQVFTINRIKFINKNFARISTGKYKITYLPNTKFVLNIEKLSD